MLYVFSLLDTQLRLHHCCYRQTVLFFHPLEHTGTLLLSTGWTATINYACYSSSPLCSTLSLSVSPTSSLCLSLSLSLFPLFFSSYPFWPCSPLSSTISVALT